jgi:rhodanese-related sulfurtransferase
MKLTLIVVIGGLLPIGLYWLFFGRTTMLTPEEARRLLADPRANVVLVDVRSSKEFSAYHVEGAINWPHDTISALRPPVAVPPQLAGKSIIVVCGSGGHGAASARKLRSLGIDNPVSIRGGMQEWLVMASAPCPAGMSVAATRPSLSIPIAFREAPLHEQWTALLTGFVVKPLYMLMSLLLVVLLFRQRSPDLAALRWALIFFFLGEAFCALNFLIYREASYLFEYLHSFGMVLAFGFTTYAVLEGIDIRLIKYSDPKAKCAAVALCRACIKHADAPCGLRRIFLLTIPAMVLVALMPLLVPFHENAYNTRILGDLYSYIHPVVHQIYEVRFLPLAAVLLFTASFWVLLFREKHPVPQSKILFACGMGAMGFSFLRMLLLAAFADNQVWFSAWEEITELLYVATAAGVLFVMRRGLFHAAPDAQTQPA